MEISGLGPSQYPRGNTSRAEQTDAASRQAEDSARADTRPGQAGKAEHSPADHSPEEQRQIEQMQTRDRQVRAHEAAHLAAAGGYARSGASFSFERGPDGRLYATGGEVSIDTSAVSGDPAATLRKAQIVQRAALAPADPSPQDRRVAAEAAAMAAQASKELALGDEGEDASKDDRVEPTGERERVEARILGSGALDREQRAGTLDLVA